MKEVGTTSWNSPNAGATNTSLFSALPGGYRNDSGSYSSIGGNGSWWSSTEYNAGSAWFCGLSDDSGYVGRLIESERDGLSVRCLRD